MSKHTPGPLVARCINTETKPFAVINPNGPHSDEIVAGFLNEADAILFAAAPDMAEALEWLVALIEADLNYVPESEALLRARAALKKARGE